MAVNKAKKSEILEQLKENIKNAKSIGFTSNLGLTMNDFNAIRKNLRTAGGTFMLAKKTLIRLAMKQVHGVDVTDEMLPGQIAIVCSNVDPVAGLGKVNEIMKEIALKKGGENKITWVASFFEGVLQGPVETKEIAGLPSRETLLGRLVGSMQSPIAGLARFFDAASKKLTTENMANLGSAPAPKKEEPKVEEVKIEEVKVEAEVAQTIAPVEEVVAVVSEATVETPTQETPKAE